MSGRYLPEEWILPELDDHNRDYFTTGELLLEACRDCGHVQHPPMGVCVACQSVETTRVAAAARGRVVSATVVRHPLHPMLRDQVPYNVVVVELAYHPGIRIVGNVLGFRDAAVPIGVGVRGSWTGPLGDRQVRLLQWEADDGPEAQHQ